jgi:hypothetical protein
VTKHDVSLSKVGIQFDRCFRDSNRVFRMPGHGKHKRQGLMGLRVGWCQTNSLLDPMTCSLECRSRRTNPPAHSDVRMAQSEQGMSVGKLGIDPDRLFEIGDRGLNVFLGHPVVGGKHTQVVIPCIEVVGSLPPCAGDLGQRDLRPDLCRYAGDNVVLQFKKITDLSVITLRPDMTIGLRIDQLRANSDPIAGSAHATFRT